MFQHLFWFFGHPEVYLPFVIVIFGLCILAFAKFFPVKWKAIVRAMKWPPSVPALWVYSGGLIAFFGSVTGFVMANSGVDLVLHDTYYIVAHFHLIIIIVSLSVFVSIIFWSLPHILRAFYNIWLGRLCWLLWSIGIGLLIFPQHHLGQVGKPQRYEAYQQELEIWNTVAMIGVIFCALALATFIALVIEALVKRRPLRDKPANLTLDAFE